MGINAIARSLCRTRRVAGHAHDPRAAARERRRPPMESTPIMTWQETLRARIPFFGHRNWIVVADSAYPSQSNPGIETLVSGAGEAEVLKEVFQSLAASKHLKPNVYCDQELAFVPEADAPGVSEYRAQLNELLQGQQVSTLPHDEIIKSLDQAGQTFKVLIIKTNMTMPYTSVFVQLDCAYWDADAQQRLHDEIKTHWKR